MRISDLSWSDIEHIRAELTSRPFADVESAAQHFAETLLRSLSTVVLVRVFVLLPFEKLPEADKDFARRLVGRHAKIDEGTPTLSLMGTAGVETQWNARSTSAGHLAIPLYSEEFATGAPMISRLLSDLGVDAQRLEHGFTAARPMEGTGGGKFYVHDANSDVDSFGRHVIANREFVETYGIRTVFGMGGPYFDGVMAIAIVFTREKVERLLTDRLASFIGTFRTHTTRLEQQGKLYAR